MDRIALAQLNSLLKEDFVARLGAIYEHSPWVAERAWPARPFATLDELGSAMQRAVTNASSDEQMALICAHPELAGRLAVAGQLTDESRREQAGVGLDRCTTQEFARLQELNAAYSDRFAFPFIVAVRGLDRAQIISRLERRLAHGREQEIAIALGEIGRIARFRLEDLVGD